MQKIIMILSAILIMLISIQKTAISSQFVHPIKEYNGLSSSFGEFRKSHFHAGIDIRTGGRNGLPVFAADDGRIYRIAINRRGFGNALYIRHADDIITLYAHLQGFENNVLKLENIVQKQRKHSGLKYPGNIFVDIPVKRGQLIAYTGESGAGLPHLHFEIRKGESNPVEPLGDFILYNDSSQPVIQNLMIKPIGAESYLDSSHESLKITLQKIGNTYKAKQTPVISGKAKIFAAMYDHIGSYYKVGIHTFSVFLDGGLLYKADFKEVSYDKWEKVGFVFDREFTINGKGYYKLYRQRGNDLPIGLGFDYDSGIIDSGNISDGKHLLKLIAADVAGNTVSCELPFISEKKGKLKNSIIPELLGKKPYKEKQIYLKPYDDFVLYYYKSTSDSIIKAVIPGGENYILNPISLEDGIFYGEFKFKTNSSGDYEFILQDGNSTVSSERIFIESARPDRENVITFNSGKLHISGNAIYEDLFIYPEKAYKPAPFILPALCSAVRLNPVGSSFGVKSRISFQYPPDTLQSDASRAGVYRFNRDCGWWEYLGAVWDKVKGEVSANIMWLDIYALLVDKSPPLISNTKPGNNSHINEKYPTLFANIKDLGSGIDDLSLKVTIDGAEVDAEFDPDRGWFSYKLKNPLAKGKHVMKVNIKDNAKNPAKEAVSTFFVD
ncbi:peptidoglycan DD-metalloendopeptidase family protein [bacterium]|nr:peptidoglycan DD-metalloendopeptidase family protein [bacterium]